MTEQGTCLYCGAPTQIRPGRRVYKRNWKEIRWDVHTCTRCKHVRRIHGRPDAPAIGTRNRRKWPQGGRDRRGHGAGSSGCAVEPPAHQHPYHSSTRTRKRGRGAPENAPPPLMAAHPPRGRTTMIDAGEKRLQASRAAGRRCANRANQPDFSTGLIRPIHTATFNRVRGPEAAHRPIPPPSEEGLPQLRHPQSQLEDEAQNGAGRHRPLGCNPSGLRGP
jgi:hypothetical protein